MAERMGGLSASVGSRVTAIEAGALLAFLSSRVVGQFDPFYPSEPDPARPAPCQKSMTSFSLALLIALAPLRAGAAKQYSKPYALFEAEQRKPAADTRPAFVMRIDGKYVKIGTNDPIPPGTHEVELSIPGTPGSSQSTRVKMSIEAKPCTRYYFAAQRSSRSARDWSAFVAGSEPIGECVRRFPNAK